MRSKIVTWGNSLALRIPKPYALEMGFEKDTPIELGISDGRLVVAKHEAETPTLDELIAGITPENLHGEMDFGEPVGNEVW
jgi:antitoxin MazE